MKVLLVRPISQKMPTVVPSLGLGYLATALRKENHEVKILDCLKERFDFSDFQKYLANFNPGVVGIQVFTCDYGSTKKMLKITKEYNPKIITLIGGPHVSGSPLLTLKDMDEADFGVVGEAENSLKKLLNKDLSKENHFDDISGLVYREGDNIIINPVNWVEDINSYGFPAWDLMDPRTYPLAPHGAFTKQSPVATIITTRGCPFCCTYCSAGINSGKILRKRKIDDVIEEIELLYHKYGVREIHIEDDNFTFDKNHVIEFCHKLMAKNLNLSWACPNGVRLDTLDKEILQLMEKAGCYSFAIGIESGSPRILKLMRRIVTREKMIEKVNLIKKNTNIRMTGFCILGYPGETKEDLKMTVDFACELPIHRVSFGNFLPLPGTEIFNELIKTGEIKEEELNWEDYITTRTVYSPKGILLKELKKNTKSAIWKFYSRPKIFLGLLQEIHSPQHAWSIAKKLISSFSS